MKVLVADDDPTSRLITRTAVQSLGHECHTVNDGMEAWTAFHTLRPDVVISDRRMPVLSGVELCRRIRADSQRTYTYFIMVTSHDSSKQILEGTAAGADDYLIKPLDCDDLEGRLVNAGRVTELHNQLAQQRTQLENLNHELSDIARCDALTGLANRRALQEDLETLQSRVTRYAHSYCVAILDIDHFKSYNDTNGHQAGDEALQAVAAKLKERARGGDSVYRFGGEEFLCILPEQSLDTGTKAVQRMRVAVQRLGIVHEGSRHGVLTVSCGISVLDAAQTRSASEMMKEADESLYRAKALGRNQVCAIRTPTTGSEPDAVAAFVAADAVSAEADRGRATNGHVEDAVAMTGKTRLG